jgi:hypothetical protein
MLEAVGHHDGDRLAVVVNRVFLQQRDDPAGGRVDGGATVLRQARRVEVVITCSTPGTSDARRVSICAMRPLAIVLCTMTA